MRKNNFIIEYLNSKNIPFKTSPYGCLIDMKYYNYTDFNKFLEAKRIMFIDSTFLLKN